jgi:diguanylate cyclase (GGDEF)-like protein
MSDVDRFKAINDRFGHEFGDKVLVQIAGVLRSFAKGNRMLVARHGSEEFAVLIIGATNEQASALKIFVGPARRPCPGSRPGAFPSADDTPSVCS